MLLAEAEQAVGSATAARRIVAHAGGLGWAHLTSVSERSVPTPVVALVRSMVARRVTGEPLQYVLGVWGFRGLDLTVDRRALIPRPETETVVDEALAQLALTAPTNPVVVDLGTGTGAIALAVATEVAGSRVWATDVSTDALALARVNLVATVGPGERVSLCAGRWYDALPGDLAGQVDLVVSNPPYVAATDVLPEEVSGWEPSLALVSGPTGLEAVGEILAEAPRWLKPGGSLVVEIAPHQASVVVAMAAAAGLVDADVHPDLTGRLRTLVARRPDADVPPDEVDPR